MSHIRIGTSGWTYSTWKGRFYPAGLPASQQLAYLSTRLNAVELNGTFYRLQRPSTYAKWASQVTDDFEFAVKGWKQVTHIRRLRDAQPDVARFFASGVLELGTHLGPILWQLPPSLKFDASALDTFLADLPQTVGEARELAASVPAEDDAEDAQPVLLPVPEPDDPAPEVPASTPLRYAIEPRNATFGAPEALQTLRDHNAAMVISDTAGRHPMFQDVTADFVYIRLHGAPRIYFSAYSQQTLEAWAARIATWAELGIGTDIFFDNTGSGHAPHNAATLADLVLDDRRGGGLR